MKYYKFKKITGGENPIIRITYKNFWGNLIIKDVIKHRGWWKFMENGRLVFDYDPIENFLLNNIDEYYINQTNLK